MPSMQHIVLLSCVSKKLHRPAPAHELYVSPLFKLALGYARQLRPSNIYVLSAKYGLVGIDEVIEPYDTTLNTMSLAGRRAWATRILEALGSRATLNDDHFTFLAGDRYRVDLVPNLRYATVPMQGMRIGEQLQFLSRKLSTSRG